MVLFQIKQSSLDGGNVETTEIIIEKTPSLPVDSNRAADNDVGGLDSGIAGSYRETSSDIAVSLDVHKKAGNYTDTADKLLACAEQSTFFSTSLDRETDGGLVIKQAGGGSEEEKEKFTTETEEMVSSFMWITYHH